MAYVKFGWEKSDVYLFGGVTGASPDDDRVIVCAMCMLNATGPEEDRYDRESEVFGTKEAVLAHLGEHRAAGHVVPESAIEKIRNDDWI